jgi:hypothetical protein
MKEITNMSLVIKMLEINPKRDPIFTAIDKLKAKSEIKQFYSDLIEYYKQLGFDRGNPETFGKSAEELAAYNVGYILGYYSKYTMEIWYKILNIGHPIFLGLGK